MRSNSNLRESNIELLRILCMFGVIVSHALQSLYDLHSTDFSIANNARIIILDASVVAVNCFIFISGYFRIKQSWKGFFNLYTQLLFYSFIAFVVIFLLLGKVNYSRLIIIVFPLTANGMWFIPTYFGLFLMAPILNKALDAQTVNDRRISLGLLLMVDVYIGYMHQIEEVSVNGYHLIHFVMLYYMGACLCDIEANYRAWWGWGWLALVVIGAGLHAIKMVFPQMAIFYSMRYNSPYVVLTSVCFFMWIRTYNFQSAIINNVAKSVLSVYIISSLIPGYYEGLHYIQKNTSTFGTASLVPIYIVVYYCLCIFIDRTRIACCTPLINYLAKRGDMITRKLKG